MNDKLLNAVYAALLRHPHDNWRTDNQKLYCAVRDRVADQFGMDSQLIQDWFEQEAVQDWWSKHVPGGPDGP